MLLRDVEMDRWGAVCLSEETLARGLVRGREAVFRMIEEICLLGSGSRSA